MLSKWRFWFGLAGFLLFAAFVWYFSDVVAWVLIAGVISLLARPICEQISKIHIGKFKLGAGFSAAITLVIFYVLLGLLIRMMVPIFYAEAQTISSINFHEFATSLEKPLLRAEAWIAKYQILDLAPGETFSEYSWEQIKGFLKENQVTNIVGDVLGMLGNLLFAILAITFITFFFLKEPTLFKRIIFALIPSQFEDQSAHILSRTKQTLRSYSLALLSQITIIFVLVTLGLTIVGLLTKGEVSFKTALLIGFFAGIINLIPYLGPIIGFIFGILIGLTTNLALVGQPGFGLFLFGFCLVFLITQAVDNFFTQPVLFSKSVQAHPLEIFLVIIISGNLAGIPGMILAVPFYSFLRIFLKEFFSENKVVKGLTAKMQD